MKIKWCKFKAINPKTSFTVTFPDKSFTKLSNGSRTALSFRKIIGQ